MMNLSLECQRACKELEPRLTSKDRRIIAVAMVRNEDDIIERFVRHCLTWADALLVVDHGSCDETPIILRKLEEEELCLAVVTDPAIGKHQADRITMLAKAAAVSLSAAIIVPLDADEFLVHSEGEETRERLLSLPADAVTFASWLDYVPTPHDDPGEIDVLRRITHRRKNSSEVTKVILGGRVAAEADFRVAHGSHWLVANDARISKSPSGQQFRLAHFPVRSAGQVTAKVLITPLAGMLDSERFPTAQEHYGQLRARAPVNSYMTAAELQHVAENYAGILSVVAPEIVFDPLKACSGDLRYTKATHVDAAYRVEQFTRSLIENLVRSPGAVDGPIAVRELISAENERLLASNKAILAEYDALLEKYEALLHSKSLRLAFLFRRIWRALAMRS